jgi:hypothetical protein
LIVISILAILSGIMIVVINPARYMTYARDARRISDIRALANSISYAISGGTINLQDTTSGCTSCTSITGTKEPDGSTGWVKFTTTNSDDLSNYISTLPIDPINNSTYYYEFASNGIKFEINATLEDLVHYVKLTNEGGTDLSKYEVGTSLTLIP